MARLVRVEYENAAPRRTVRLHEIPAARTPGPAEPAENEANRASSRPVKVRHVARHARSSDLRPRHRTSLSIRSAERRRWAADLTGPGSGGLVIYGMGGIGKSTLAAQIATRVSRLQSGRMINVINGELATSAPWPPEADLVILDNFDDNLTQESSGRWTVRDPELAAALSGWHGKLLITCRHPFSLGEVTQARLTFRRLGPLTRSGAAELTTSLPAIRLLGEAERDQVWRLTAGHPLAMEYFDRLLARGERYPDLAGRIEAAIRAWGDLPPEPTELPEATAERVASAAGDLMFGDLFGRLGTAARSQLVRASVFRTPVTAEAVGARPGPIAECEAAGLLGIGPGHEVAVHRWTAAALHRRLAEAGLGAQLAAAHRQAAAYWLSCAAPSAEAGYHQRRAAELTRVAGPGPRPGPSLRRRAAVLALAAVSVALAVEAGRALAVPHLASAERPAGAVSSVTLPSVTGASATRARAAAWVAGQVSGGAVLACDPAMCAALAQRGVPAGSLLVLGPGAGDPLGSAVVVETAAVRSIFGSRLASVYAPEVLASFGAGPARIDVRIVAPDGAASYRRALAADSRARRAAGVQLLRDPRITVTPSARAALAAGQVDARLLMTLAALAASEPVRVDGFGGRDPGESPGLALRTAELAAPAATERRMLAFVRAQRSPYLATRADLTPGPGGAVLTIEFGAPAPLGMLR